MVANFAMFLGGAVAVVAYVFQCYHIVANFETLIACIWGPCMGFAICLCLFFGLRRKTAEESVRWALLARAYKQEADELRGHVMELEEERMRG